MDTNVIILINYDHQPQLGHTVRMSTVSRGSKQKNCAHFEESIKLCMDKL